MCAVSLEVQNKNNSLQNVEVVGLRRAWRAWGVLNLSDSSLSTAVTSCYEYENMYWTKDGGKICHGLDSRHMRSSEIYEVHF